MLKVIHSVNELDYTQFMEVYRQSNHEKGQEYFPNLSPQEQLIRAEQEVYTYLRTEFFADQEAFYAIWEVDGRYVSALRLEPYKDGLLLEALETAPDARGNGHSKALLGAALGYLKLQRRTKVYSHVGKRNRISLAVHKACGFEISADHAVYIDGSVSHSAYTLCYSID